MVVLRAAAVAALIVILAGCGGDEQETATTPAENNDPAVVAQIKVGSNPCLAAPVGSEVWVSVYTDAQLVRIDPRDE